MTTRKLALLTSLLLTLACDPAVGPACQPSPGTICTVAGTGRAAVAGDLGPAWQAALYLPMDTEIGPDGRVYVVDWNNHRLRVFDVGGAIDTFAGTGILGDGPVGPALEAAFNHPTNIVFDSAGRMHIAAWHNSRIRMIDPSTMLLSDICGTGARSYTGEGGPAAMAALDLPAGIAFDPDGRLVIVDQANQMLRRVEADGTIHRIAGQCIVNEPATGTDVLETCAMNARQGYGVAANPDLCMLPCLPGYAGDGGDAMSARFAFPFGQSADPSGRLAIDRDGRIYLADTRNHRIRMIDVDGTVSTIAGVGTAGTDGETGPATSAQLNGPVDLELGADGTLFVADTFNSCVRAIGTDGMIRTVAGICGRRGFEGDGGPPASARLDRPYGIDIDADGNLWITDTHNHRVRVVTAPF